MDNRVAMIGIIVSSREASASLNEVLHEYSDCIIGRMGLPYQERRVSVISVIVDAPQAVISALSGKLGMIPHVSSKTIYVKMPE